MQNALKSKELRRIWITQILKIEIYTEMGSK